MNDREIELWSWLSKQGPKTIETVFERAGVSRKQIFRSTSQLKYEIEKGGRRKAGDSDTPEQRVAIKAKLDETHELRFDRMVRKRKKKNSPKAMKIRRNYYVIKGLRERGGSWEDIRIYLKRSLKLDVSRGYFAKIWAELENEFTPRNEREKLT